MQAEMSSKPPSDSVFVGNIPYSYVFPATFVTSTHSSCSGLRGADQRDIQKCWRDPRGQIGGG